MTYKVNDGLTDSNTATISIVTDYALPAAQAGSYEITSSTPTVVTLSGISDNSSTLSYAITDIPSRGILYDGPDATGHQITSTDVAAGPYTLSDSLHRVFFVPEAHKYGVDNLSFDVTDSIGESDPAQISLSVVPPTNAPSIPDEPAFDTFTGGSVTGIDLASFVSFPSGSSQAITINQPNFGTLAFNSGTGKYDYTADASHAGPVEFTFEASDGTNTTLGKGTFFCQATGTSPIDQSVNSALAAAVLRVRQRSRITFASAVGGFLDDDIRAWIVLFGGTSGSRTFSGANLVTAYTRLTERQLGDFYAALRGNLGDAVAATLPNAGWRISDVSVVSQIVISWDNPSAGSPTGARATIRVRYIVSYTLRSPVGTDYRYSSPIEITSQVGRRL